MEQIKQRLLYNIGALEESRLTKKYLLFNKGVNKIDMTNLSQSSLTQAYQVLKSTFLTIYDEIFITDMSGIIIEKSGQITELWENPQEKMIGKNLFELGRNVFYEELSLQDLLNQSHPSTTQTSWDGKEILITAYPVNIEPNEEFVAWGFKNISSNPTSSDDHPKSDHLQTSFIVRSKKMRHVMNTVELVSKVSSSVLLLGESGVGKEVIAKAIHQIGARKNEPFVAVNCGAIPENLLESELFGYVEGAFSGAKKNGALGKFELANKGILFLDEIGEMPLNLQVKLLRALQEKEITPIGGATSRKIDIQVISATNQSLEKMVKEGKFREDLYYRLNVVPIEIPSLRARMEEIPHLIYFFLQKYNDLYNRNVQINPAAIDVLTIYQWPGNVRQLKNTIERIVVTSEHPMVDAIHVKKFIPIEKNETKTFPVFDHLMPLQDAIDLVEEQLITMAMEKYHSIKLAAIALNISQPTMSRKYKKIQNKRAETVPSPSKKRAFLEEQLNNQLRSAAIVTAAIIQPEEVQQLKENISATNPIFQKLQANLTMIRKQEGVIKWAYIFSPLPDNSLITLVADEDFVMKPGELYQGPDEIIKIAHNALQGKVEVTPLYKDRYGEWKTSFAPVFDHSGQVLALIGYDYSKEYIDSELRKMGRVLKIHI
ncbi:sigma-54 interaction domain-containing protein [Bacillus sp. FJAT-52991]|uniref:Sigma 54-interacting transcriptional regulator n=1 Tax=Bacillus kandeliae TaxID=3129297 RepID=A0ABZ2N5K1_9BACI